jgi:uncharacterized protein
VHGSATPRAQSAFGTTELSGAVSDVVAGHQGEAGPRLRSSDGIPLATRCWISDRPNRGSVVLVHGLAGSKDDPRLVMLASQLHGRGFDVIAYDARGHGFSGGTCTLGQLERLDVAAAVAWAQTRNQRVVVIGASLGAVAALSYAAAARVLAGVVTVSSPADWRLPLRVHSVLTACLARTWIGRAYADRRMNVRISRWKSPPTPRSLLENITCPLVAVHGMRDSIIPPTSGLAKVLAEDHLRSSVLVDDMGHAFDPSCFGIIGEAVEWLMACPFPRGNEPVSP